MKKFFIVIINIVFWLAVWQVIAICVNKEVLVASPLSVLKRLTVLVTQGYFWVSTFSSLLRICIGFIIGVIISIIISVLTYKIKIINILTQPLLVIIKSTPVASFIILAIVWLNKSDVPIFTTILMVLPIMWTNLYTGINSIDKNLKEMVSIFNVPLFARIKKFYIPSVTPYFKAGCISSIGLAWKAGIAAEVLCTPKDSIGKYLLESKLYLETPDLFAWTAVVIILSLILEKILVRLMGGEKNAGT